MISFILFVAFLYNIRNRKNAGFGLENVQKEVVNVNMTNDITRFKTTGILGYFIF